MTAPTTRETIVAVAQELFAERGYTATTIKDVADRAGFSPAMVMKVMGSKAELYAAAAPSDLPADESAGSGGAIGLTLVRTIVERRDAGEAERWAMLPFLIHEAPVPESIAAELRERYLRAISERISDTSPDRITSQLVIALLLGLAGTIRTLGLLTPGDLPSEDLIRGYGALVQSVVDGDA
ncbi:transcriptional regulator, TetR family [Sanguibacter gelidistatuariae]|uniref:Transcriptional regulator, TetR family n=1 Tax=Sanguibacter gelidistatuariae TaxID=1814289 RepID=A0A1G6GSG6_9MICO|nr:TetR/AcrR family transcriptional regulator [Sanguibacter gelidistatuariae]SDB84869.1 transcriptional regulator, TetR family [Sanguibacter gelidistatuariae]